MTAPYGLSPLGYQGLKEKDPPNIRFDTKAPTTQDYKIFDLGDIWIDQSPALGPDVYMLTDKAMNVATWTLISVGAGDVTGLLSDAGAPNVVPTAGNITLAGGSGITTSGQGPGSTLTITNTAQSIISWTVDAASPVAPLLSEGHISTTVPITYNLPAAAAIGDTFAFIDGGTRFTIQAGGGQTVRVGSSVTGAGGTCVSTGLGDTLTIVCVVANTSFFAISSIGTFVIT